MESEDKKPIFTRRLILGILIVILIILIIFLLLRRCGSGNGGGDNPSGNTNVITQITINPAFVNLKPNERVDNIYATADGEGDLIWTSENPSCVTVEANGNQASLIAGSSPCETNIRVCHEDVCSVLPVVVASDIDPLQGIKLNQSNYRLRVGQSVAVTVTPDPATAQLPSYLTYSIEETKIATVNEYGVIKGRRVGTTYLTVSTPDGMRATALVTVTYSSTPGSTPGGNGGEVNVPVTKIEFDSNNATEVCVGQKIPIGVMVTPSNATNKALKYSLNNPTDNTGLVNAYSSISTAGYLTGIKAGTTKVTVTSKDDSTLSITTPITVLASNNSKCNNSGGDNPSGNNPGGNTTTNKAVFGVVCATATNCSWATILPVEDTNVTKVDYSFSSSCASVKATRTKEIDIKLNDNVTTECKFTVSATPTFSDGTKGKAQEVSVVLWPYSSSTTPTAPNKPTIEYRYRGSTNIPEWIKENLTVSFAAESGASIRYCKGANCNPQETGYTTQTITPTAQGSGSVTYCAVAVKNGMQSSKVCETLNYKFDTIAPTCRIDQTPRANANNQTKLEAVITDAGYIKSTIWDENNSNNTATLYVSETGKHTVVVTDAAGNTGSCSANVVITPYCVPEKTGYAIAKGKTTTVKFNCTGVTTKGSGTIVNTGNPSVATVSSPSLSVSGNKGTATATVTGKTDGVTKITLTVGAFKNGSASSGQVSVDLQVVDTETLVPKCRTSQSSYLVEKGKTVTIQFICDNVTDLHDNLNVDFNAYDGEATVTHKGLSISGNQGIANVTVRGDKVGLVEVVLPFGAFSNKVGTVDIESMATTAVLEIRDSVPSNNYFAPECEPEQTLYTVEKGKTVDVKFNCNYVGTKSNKSIYNYGDSSIATVMSSNLVVSSGEKGTATATVRGDKVGTTTIMLPAGAFEINGKSSPAKTLSVKVVDSAASAPSCKADATSYTVQKGETINVSFTCTNVTAKGTGSITNTGNPSVATVLSHSLSVSGSTGKAIAAVKGNAVGSATISLTYGAFKNGNSSSAQISVPITVTAEAPKPTVTIDADETTLKSATGTTKLKASTNNPPATGVAYYTWTSSNTSCVTVPSQGTTVTATGVNKGTQCSSTITAYARAQNGTEIAHATKTITVPTIPAPVCVAVESSYSVRVGNTVTVIFDCTGATAKGSGSITTSNTTYVSLVSQNIGSSFKANAIIKGEKVGTATITLPAGAYKNAGGNSNAVSATVKVTAEDFNCGTIAGENSTWTNSSVTVKVTCTGADCNSSQTLNQYTASGAKAVKTYAALKVQSKTGATKTCRSVNIYYDNVAPKCTVDGGSTTWTTGTRAITYKCSDGTAGSGCVRENTVVNYPERQLGYPYAVKDNAGNATTCTVPNVYIDNTAPVLDCTISTNDSPSGIKILVKANDTLSGLAKDPTGTKTYVKSNVTYTAEDKAGNTKSCTINVSYVCPSGYAVNTARLNDTTKCLKICSGCATTSYSTGSWVAGSSSYVAQPIDTCTNAAASSKSCKKTGSIIQDCYPYDQELGENQGYCYKVTNYTRTVTATVTCPTGTNNYGGYCYYVQSKYYHGEK